MGAGTCACDGAFLFGVLEFLFAVLSSLKSALTSTASPPASTSTFSVFSSCRRRLGEAESLMSRATRSPFEPSRFRPVLGGPSAAFLSVACFRRFRSSVARSFSSARNSSSLSALTPISVVAVNENSDGLSGSRSTAHSITSGERMCSGGNFSPSLAPCEPPRIIRSPCSNFVACKLDIFTSFTKVPLLLPASVTKYEGDESFLLRGRVK